MFRYRNVLRRPRQDARDRLEPLESRCLLSAACWICAAFRGGPFVSAVQSYFAPSTGQTIRFSQVPTAVQKGLDSLAQAASLSDPSSTQTVFLGNSNGVETYTVKLSSSGSTTQLTVDQTGAAVTQPTVSTSTFGAITSTLVTNEISAIAAALNLTAPASTASVKVTTPSTGAAIYTIQLTASTNGGRRARSTSISVDANGNPTGNESVPLSTLSTAIQNGLTTNAPSGASALASASLVSVRTLNGVTTYSAVYNATGIRTAVTVNANGKLASLPGKSSVLFSAVPSAAQAELQSLATAAGVAGTINPAQSVNAYDEANGTVLYSVKLTATATSSTASTYTYPIVLTVDQDGNPTIAPPKAVLVILEGSSAETSAVDTRAQQSSFPSPHGPVIDPTRSPVLFLPGYGSAFAGNIVVFRNIIEHQHPIGLLSGRRGSRCLGSR